MGVYKILVVVHRFFIVTSVVYQPGFSSPGLLFAIRPRWKSIGPVKCHIDTGTAWLNKLGDL